jgi:DNA protecting protein DprA
VTPGSRAGDLLFLALTANAKLIYEADEEAYRKIENLDESVILALMDKNLEESQDIAEYCAINNIGILPYDSPYYPSRLRRIEKAPILLYFKGKLIDIDDNVGIAAVGTRRYSDYGKREAYKICRDIAAGGAIVISGMARGIDSICHRAALDVGAHTIAVLGCGINKVYPPENEDLMNEIITHGTLISEFRPFTDPIGSNFPVRNRIISGLSLGTLVIEADQKSGAMITAKYALKQGRDIFALPGKVDEYNSQGTNELISKGAKMVRCGVDILEEYEFFYPHRISLDRIPRFSKFKLSSLHTQREPQDSHHLSIIEPKQETNLPVSKKEPPKYHANSPSDIPIPAAKSSSEKATDTFDLSTYHLSDFQTEILQLMPIGVAIESDKLARNSGIEISKILSSMTVLEIKKLVSKVPGGKYIRLK